MGLGKAQDSDNARTYLVTTLGAALDTIDVHDHSNGKGNAAKRLQNGTFAARPAAGSAGHVYVATDQNRVFFDSGGAWTEAAILGTALSAQLVLNAGLLVSSGGVEITAGGLRVTAGNVGIGAAPISQAGLYAPSALSITAASTAAYAALISTTLNAAANGDTLYGLNLSPTFTPGAFTGLNLRSISIGANATAQATTQKIGVFLGAQTGANLNNYGLYIEAASGASGANLGLYNAGTSRFDGALGIGTTATGSGHLDIVSAAGTVAASGSLRLQNAQNIGWRDSGGTGDNTLGCDASNRLALEGGWSVSTSIGAAGGASPQPATPLGYLTVRINGNTVKIPYHNT